LGPSGSGKTTLLNFLSGRIVSSNLVMNGTLKMNNVPIDSIEKYSNKIAFVQQDDILMAVFTPREALIFSANIRLNLSQEKKEEKVNKLLRDLGLEKCADTIIGNELIRGVSGGERKRTSIGVELLTNPSMIFLDEPTTGLDSNTAVTIMYLLRDMANSGRTIVSVIHQPSTEIFREFDKLILICKGNIIYQGDAQAAVDYFTSINYECPSMTNPSDFYMKIMNPEGLMIEMMEKGMNVNKENKKELSEKFEERVSYFTKKYKESKNYEELCSKETIPVKIEKYANTVSWIKQFVLLFKREFIKVFKNPFDLRVRLSQYIIFSCVCIIVYHDV
jgi:ABC-type multidrug transport system ATPase subunit